MLEYVLKVSVVLAVGFAFYKAVLQQESFFSINRLYLLACIGLAFLLPLVTVPKLVQHQGYLSLVLEQFTSSAAVAKPEVPQIKLQPEKQTEQQVQQKAEPQIAITSVPDVAGPKVAEQAVTTAATAAQTEATEAASAPTAWLFWLAVLYVFGVAVFILNLLLQIGLVLYKVYRCTDKVQDGNFTLVNLSGKQAPCSFFHYIFLNPDDYDFATYEQVVAHEKIHARQGHTYDLLLAELAIVVLWFNPFSWLFKREVEKNLEYQTDDLLLKKERFSADEYQLSLLQIACPHKPLNITTSFNQSLLKQRIMMMNAKKSTLHNSWKYAFMAPVFFATLLFLNEPAISRNVVAIGRETPFLFRFTDPTQSQAKLNSADTPAQVAAQTKQLPPPETDFPDEKKTPVRKQKPMPAPAVSVTPAQPQPQPYPQPATQAHNGLSVNIKHSADITEGFWYGHSTDKEYCLDLKGSRTASSWNISNCYPKSQFTKKADDQFVLVHDAGTLQLNGKLDEEVSQGKYVFTEDASFKEFLAKQDINSTNQNFLFYLFLGEVDRKYINFLKTEYAEVSGKRLADLALHGIKQPEFAQYLALFRKHADYKPSMQEVVEAQIHGINEAYIAELQKAGYKDVPLRKLMEARIHGVDAAYVQELRKAGFTDLPLSKVINAKIHGVDAASVKEISALGFGDLSMDKITELQIHGVNAAYVKELKAAGFPDLTLNKVLTAKIHGLSSENIKRIRNYGLRELSWDKLIEAQIHGVNGAFLEGLAKEGFKNITADKAIEARIHGVTAEFIKQARKEGYNLKTLDEYINVKIMGLGRARSRD